MSNPETTLTCVHCGKVVVVGKDNVRTPFYCLDCR